MKKSDIQTHGLGMGYRSVPALNVKARDWNVTGRDVAAKYGCSEKAGDKACEYAWEMSQSQFWEDAESIVADIYPGHKVYSEGRCGGWLYVDGLPPLDSWDAVAVAKWSKLARCIRESLAYVQSESYILENIEANEWHKEGAERYNFIDCPDGGHACIADLKAQAVAAGFGPVVRG